MKCKNCTHFSWKNFFFSFLAVLYFQNTNVIAKKEVLVLRDPAWFRICDNPSQIIDRDITCRKGVWRNSTDPLGCVCVNGVWILSNGFCDDESLILVGKGHCFDITTEVRRIQLLGIEDDPFYPSIFTGPSTFDVFKEISDIFGPNLETESTSVIAVNPINAVQRIDDLVCIQATKKEGKPLYIYNNGWKNVNQWKLNQENCNLPDDYHHKVAFGEIYSNGKIVAANAAVGTCTIDKCKETGVPTGRKMESESESGVPKLDGDGKLHYGRSAYANPVSVSAPFQIVPGSADEEKLKCLKNRAEVTINPEQYEIETKEQTIRLVKAHLGPVLLDTYSIEPNSREMEYLYMARRIVLNSCPSGPDMRFSMLTHSTTRMFKRLMQETHSKFPYIDGPDNMTYYRILNKMNECYNDSEAMKQHETTDPKTKCIINAPIIEGIPYTNTSTYANVSNKMPEYIRSNNSKYDMVIEMGWKMVLAATYKCSMYFKDSSDDFSFLVDKLQSIFNPEIIKRWHQNHEAQKVYDFIFQRVNLQSWLDIFDECVAALKNLSPLNEWMLRPKIPETDNDLSQARPKRSVNSDPRMIWDGKGYCINNFFDPISKLNDTSNLKCRVEKLKYLA